MLKPTCKQHSGVVARQVSSTFEGKIHVNFLSVYGKLCFARGCEQFNTFRSSCFLFQAEPGLKRIEHIRSEITTSGSGHHSKKSLSGDRAFWKMGDNLSCCGHEAPGLQCVEVGWWHLDLFEKFGYVMSSYFLAEGR